MDEAETRGLNEAQNDEPSSSLLLTTEEDKVSKKCTLKPCFVFFPEDLSYIIVKL